MATTQVNSLENLSKPYRSFKGYPQTSNGISFWAFLLSIFIYISIFYLFNLSPMSLFNTTKFWFFISNTLILIIAADYGAFSSSKELDFYEEFVKHSQKNSFSSYELPNMEIVKKNNPNPIQEVEKSQGRIKEVVLVHEREIQENKLEIVVKDDSKNPSGNFQGKLLEYHPKAYNETHEKEKNESRFVRSMSHKVIPMTRNENKIVLRRSDTEKRDKSEDENEFSCMSDEELNRRVEEFIKKFNRQIRLQAVARNIRPN